MAQFFLRIGTKSIAVVIDDHCTIRDLKKIALKEFDMEEGDEDKLTIIQAGKACADECQLNDLGIAKNSTLHAIQIDLSLAKEEITTLTKDVTKNSLVTQTIATTADKDKLVPIFSSPSSSMLALQTPPAFDQNKIRLLWLIENKEPNEKESKPNTINTFDTFEDALYAFDAREQKNENNRKTGYKEYLKKSYMSAIVLTLDNDTKLQYGFVDHLYETITGAKAFSTMDPENWDKIPSPLRYNTKGYYERGNEYFRITTNKDDPYLVYFYNQITDYYEKYNEKEHSNKLAIVDRFFETKAKQKAIKDEAQNQHRIVLEGKTPGTTNSRVYFRAHGHLAKAFETAYNKGVFGEETGIEDVVQNENSIEFYFSKEILSTNQQEQAFLNQFKVIMEKYSIAPVIQNWRRSEISIDTNYLRYDINQQQLTYTQAVNIMKDFHQLLENTAKSTHEKNPSKYYTNTPQIETLFRHPSLANDSSEKKEKWKETKIHLLQQLNLLVAAAVNSSITDALIKILTEVKENEDHWNVALFSILSSLKSLNQVENEKDIFLSAFKKNNFTDLIEIQKEIIRNSLELHSDADKRTTFNTQVHQPLANLITKTNSIALNINSISDIFAKFDLLKNQKNKITQEKQQMTPTFY